IDGRFVDDDRALRQGLAHRLRRLHDGRQVGDVVVIDRRRDRDDEERHALEVGDVAGDRQPGSLELALVDLLVPIEPAAQLVDLLPVHVEADAAWKLAREGQRHGQAHVSESDDGDLLLHGCYSSKGEIIAFSVPAVAISRSMRVMEIFQEGGFTMYWILLLGLGCLAVAVVHAAMARRWSLITAAIMFVLVAGI